MGRTKDKCRINVAGARERSSFSREVNNAINEGKLACSHRGFIGNNVVNKANDILHHYTVSLYSTKLTFSDTCTVYLSTIVHFTNHSLKSFFKLKNSFLK